MGRLRRYSESDADPYESAHQGALRDGGQRPLQSYAVLIAEALEASEQKQLTLVDIYDYIETNYPYYRREAMANRLAWRNSIRHTLSLNHAFHKADHHRRRGSLWTFAPGISVRVLNGRLLVDDLSVQHRPRANSLPDIQATRQQSLLLPKPLRATPQLESDEPMPNLTEDWAWAFCPTLYQLGTPPWMRKPSIMERSPNPLPKQDGEDVNILNDHMSLGSMAKSIMRQRPVLLPRPTPPRDIQLLIRRDPWMTSQMRCSSGSDNGSPHSPRRHSLPN